MDAESRDTGEVSCGDDKPAVCSEACGYGRDSTVNTGTAVSESECRDDDQSTGAESSCRERGGGCEVQQAGICDNGVLRLSEEGSRDMLWKCGSTELRVYLP